MGNLYFFDTHIVTLSEITHRFQFMFLAPIFLIQIFNFHNEILLTQALFIENTVEVM